MVEEAPPAEGRGLGLLVVGVALLLGAVAALSWVTTPRVVLGSASGVSSDDHVLYVLEPDDPFDDDEPRLHVVPTDADGSSTLLFTIRNDGPLPVTVVDVLPEEDEPRCGWTPDVRELRVDPPELIYTDDRVSAVPVGDVRVEPGREATVWLTGRYRGDDCSAGALTYRTSATVVVRIGGRTSEVELPLRDTVAWTDDAERFADQDGVEVVTP